MSANWSAFAVALVALSCCLAPLASATNYNQDWSWQGVGLPSTFEVVLGDTVTFQLTELHNVLLFSSKATYDACDFSDAIVLLPDQTNGSYIFPALGEGTFYLGCSVGPHCTKGLMRTIVDVSVKTETAKTETITKHVVSQNYNQDWSWQGVGLPSTFEVVVGDTVTLVLTELHNVLLFSSKATYDACDFSDATMLLPDQTNGSYIFPALGEGTFYLGCSVGPHCTKGLMRMIVDVSAKTKTITKRVEAQNYQQVWSFGAASLPAAIEVMLGDTVTFQLESTHNILLFTGQSAYDNCDFTDALTLLPTQTNGSYTFPANGAGLYYVGCSLKNHCSKGNMKISIRVLEMMNTVTGLKTKNINQVWSFGAAGLPSHSNLYVGDTVTFHLSGTHNVMLFASEAAYNNCSFTGAKTLLPTQTNGSYVFWPAFGHSHYFMGSSVGSDCLEGNMKITISIS